MKTYRRHYCTKKHSSYNDAAKCIWRYAEWIQGSGQFAVLAWCSVLTITLHPTLDRAQAAIAEINDTACGGKCHNDHELVRLADPGEMRTAR